jgi:predicted nucleic acid-binding protein
MNAYLLDTNHMGQAIRVASPLRERIFRSRQAGVRFACTSGVLCELEAGMIQSKDFRRFRRILKLLLNEVRIWPVDHAAVRKFGEVHLLLKQRGRVLSHVDKTLAALALTTNATVLTTDGDFKGIPEVRTENWLR